MCSSWKDERLSMPQPRLSTSPLLRFAQSFSKGGASDMGKVFTRSGALFLFLLSVGQLATQSQSSAGVTLVKSARLLDPKTGNVLSPAAVLIEDNKIKEVGPPSKVQAPAGAKSIDLGNATLLPGLI